MEFGKLIEWLKLSTKQILAVALIAGFLTFSPQRWLEAIHLSELTNKYNIWISLLFLGSAALLATEAITVGLSFIKTRLNWRRNLARLQKSLTDLSVGEKEVLKEYVLERTKTQTLNIMSGIAQGLVAGDIIFRASSIGHGLGHMDYNIQPWAWDYLNRNPHLIMSAEEITHLSYLQAKETMGR